MNRPITWKNVNAPNLRGVSDLFKSAQHSLSASLGDIGNIIEGGLSRERKATEANTDDFLNQLRTQFNDPDELREAQNSGAIDTLRNQYKSLNTKRSNNLAIDDLVNSLRKKVNQDNAFADDKLRRDSIPHLENIAKLTAEGDFEGAKKVLADKDLFDEAGQIRNISQAEKAAKAAKRSDAAYFRGIKRDDRIEARAIRNEERQIAEEEERDRAALRQEELSGLVTSALVTRRNQEDFVAKNESEMFNTARDAGINLLQINDPEYLKTLDRSQLDVVAGFQENIKNNSALLPNTSEELRGLERSLLDSGASAGEINQTINALNTAFTQSNPLSTIDQQAFDNEKAQIDAAFSDSSTVQEIKNPKPPAQIMSELRQENAHVFEELGVLSKDKVENLFDKMANGGFTFEGHPIKLTKPMISEALQRIDGRALLGFGDRHIEDVINDMLGTGTWNKDIEDGVRYQQALADLNARKSNARNSGIGTLSNNIFGAQTENARRFLDAQAEQNGNENLNEALQRYTTPDVTEELRKFFK